MPVPVAGPVQCGDLIGPKLDGTGEGIVTSLEAGPVIGIALAGKDSDGVAAIKTLCFAGYNALTPLGACLKENFQKVPPAQIASPIAAIESSRFM